MTLGTVTVAIPVRNGGALLGEVLRAVSSQRVDRELEIVVADSGSSDGSRELARALGAEVFTVERFSHGGTRNELMRRSHGEHVAFLTQDATPLGDRWLATLLDGFGLADEVGLVCGPYAPRPGTARAIVRELAGWFSVLSPDGRPRVDRDPAARGPGPVAFFTDANGCVARAAWERVPFREVAYAEDQVLALDMQRAGFAKVFHPGAVALHSHDYGIANQFKRSFDEWRALREVHGWVEPASPRGLARTVLGRVRDDWQAMRAEQVPFATLVRETARSARHWTVRTAGAVAGSRADRLSPVVRRACSLEGRASFEPLAWARAT